MNKKLLLIPLLVCSLTGIVGCNNPGTSQNSEQIVAKYNVYFSAGEGVKIPSQKVTSGQKTQKPEDPSSSTRTFAGWYLNPNFQGEPFDFNTPITANITLYAKFSSVSQDVIDAYNQEWADKSEANHLYIHYYRFNNKASEYQPHDVWVWIEGSSGVIWNWEKDSNGNIIVDELGGAYIDIDLTQTHHNGWDSSNKKPENVNINYLENGQFKDKIGFLITETASRKGTGHWVSDGGDIKIDSAELKWENGSYHVFFYQNNCYNGWTKELTGEEKVDPYANDDGKNFSQANINSSSKSKYGKSASSPLFKNEVGVGYQVMVSSFADSDGDGMGDILGITKKVKYLHDNLHINTLWLTPVQLSDSYHGYDIIDYKVIDPKFGSKSSQHSQGTKPTRESAMKDYEDLLAECKKYNINVLMDLVINHTSKNNVWFQESCQLNPDFRSYYQWKNSSTVKGLDSWHQYSDTAYSYYGKFSPSMPELNYDFQGTRDAMVDVAHFWLNKGVSGFRIDAIKHIYMQDEVNTSKGDIIAEDKGKPEYNANFTKNENFFQEFNGRIKEKYPNAILLGENFDGAAKTNVAPYYSSMDSMFDFFMYFKLSNTAMGDSSGNNARANSVAVEGSNDGWNFGDILKDYNKNTLNGNNAIDSVFTSNHDVPRMMNMMNGTANNADDQNARNVSASEASKAIARAKCYSTVLTMLPGITWIYYGDELGMTSNYASGETKDSPHADRWYRQPYKFGNETSGTPDSDGVYQTGFSFTGGDGYSIQYDSYNKSTLKSASDQLKDSNSLLNHFSKITELKSSKTALINGTYTGIRSSETVFAFKRVGGGETYYIYVNFGASNASVSLPSGTHLYKFGSVSNSSLGAHSGVIIKA